MLVSYRWIAPVFACCAVLAYADPQPIQKPQESKRSRPTAIPNVLKEYNYAEQVTALSDPANLTSVPGAEPVQPQYAGKAVTNRPTKELKNILTRTDVALTATALEAVRVSEKWRTENNAPSGWTRRSCSVQLWCRPPDRSLCAASRLHHRIAGWREDCRRAADRRLCQVEHLSFDVRRQPTMPLPSSS